MRSRALIALLLIVSTMLGMVACLGDSADISTTPYDEVTTEPNDSTESGTETTESTTQEGSEEITEPTTGSTETTKIPDVELPVGERLIYFEDFEDEPLSTSSDSVLSSLGWVKDTVSNGAYKNNTTSYSIVSKDGSKQLYLQNNKSGGSDSYVTLLSDELMGVYHEQNYTYQYDVNYESSGDAKRYIALVSEYSGRFYNSFHLRNNGSANNQCHTDSSWLTYDAKGPYYASSTDINAISNKLLGVKYSDSAKPMQGLSISIRYLVDWKNGNSVYLRLNTAGYPNTGKWIIVSKASPSAGGASVFKPEVGGAAIALKTGSTINGYVDNIIIWEGLGNEPADKSAPLLSSKDIGCSGHVYYGDGSCIDPNKCRYCGALSSNNKGHEYAAVSGLNDQRCVTCLSFKSSVDSGWLLSKLPAYSGGATAKKLYNAGHGIEDRTFSELDDSEMIIVARTGVTEFSAYRKKLVSYGATEVYNYTLDGNIYYQYDFRGEAFVYTYYTASVKEVRIIYDNQSDCTPQEFGYTYTKKAGDTTLIYQYGVPMQDGSADDSKKINHGHIYVMKLADNSVFVFDGGGYQQFDEKQIDGFMSFLREITGTPAGQKVKISAWYISHGHQDHMAGICLFVKKYHQEVDFDRIFFNIPSVNSDIGVFATATSHKKLIGYIDQYIRDDGVKYIKIHTGQVFSLADIKINVLYTHEDIVNPITGASEVANDYNNSCSVIKIELDGKSFIFFGDINKPAMNVLIANNSAATLKTDVIQLAHHVLNDLRSLYDITKAPVVFSPQSYYGATLNSTRTKTLETAMKYVTDDMIFFANEATYGIEVKNGKFVKTYEKPVINVQYSGWSW